MTPADRSRADEICAALASHAAQTRALPGVAETALRDAFVAQLLESLRRVRYVRLLGTLPLSPLRADGQSGIFDPIKAAILKRKSGEHDEACWLVFLSVHFGRPRRSGWLLVGDVYSGLGGAAPWSWARVSANPQAFRHWLAANTATLKSGGRRFGNHRKYQSIDAWSAVGTGAAIESYVGWVAPPQAHRDLFDRALAASKNDPHGSFDYLYDSMSVVTSFGRTARFDYLTMLRNVGLAPIEPGSVFLEGATGPLAGARLLFGGSVRSSLKRADLETWLGELRGSLDVGMDVLEDALCNWQKSPKAFVRFRG